MQSALRLLKPHPSRRLLVSTSPTGLPSTVSVLIKRNLPDTGTTLLFLPDTIVRAYYRSVRDSGYNYALGGYTYPCSVTLPSLTLGIGSYKAVIPGSYVTFQPVDSECKDTRCYSSYS